MKTTILATVLLILTLGMWLGVYINNLRNPQSESLGETYRLTHLDGTVETITMNWCRFENGGESVYMFCQDREEHWFAARVLQAREIRGGE